MDDADLFIRAELVAIHGPGDAQVAEALDAEVDVELHRRLAEEVEAARVQVADVSVALVQRGVLHQIANCKYTRKTSEMSTPVKEALSHAKAPSNNITINYIESFLYLQNNITTPASRGSEKLAGNCTGKR